MLQVLVEGKLGESIKIKYYSKFFFSKILLDFGHTLCRAWHSLMCPASRSRPHRRPGSWAQKTEGFPLLWKGETERMLQSLCKIIRKIKHCFKVIINCTSAFLQVLLLPLQLQKEDGGEDLLLLLLRGK